MKTYFYPVECISDTAYSYAVARLRTLEARSLMPEDYDRMLQCADEADVLRILDVHGYEKTRRSADESYDQLIHSNLVHALVFIEGLLPEKHRWFSEYFRADIDAINLKRKAKAVIAGQDENPEYIDGGTADTALLAELSPEECGEKLPVPWRAVWNRFYALYSAGELTDYRETSVLFDSGKMGRLKQLAERMGSGFIREFTGVRIDCLNIGIFFRTRGDEDAGCRYFAGGGNITPEELEYSMQSSGPGLEIWASTPYLPYIRRIEEEGRKTQAIERETTRIMSDYLSNAKYVTFGPEVICTYYFRVRRELMNIKTVLMGRGSAVDGETVRKRLVVA